MTTYTIDTKAATKRLVESGMPEAQAEAVVDTFAEVQEEVVTTTHLRELKSWMLSRMLMMQVGTVAVLYGLIRLFGVG